MTSDQSYDNDNRGRRSLASTTTSTNIDRPSLPTPHRDNCRHSVSGGGTASLDSPGGNLNSFNLPDAFRTAASCGSPGAGGNHVEEPRQRYFYSRRLRKDDIDKPSPSKRDPKEKWITILPLVGIFIGLGISGFLVYDGLNSVVHHKYCPILDESFDSGLRDDIWTKEVAVGGFGNGEFEETVASDENVFIQNGNLVIKATLQDADKVDKDTVVNLLEDGTCTSTAWQDCVAATNTTTGNSSIVPPTKSGRINTRKGAKLKYGRVEVTAKLPHGDWLWPAIWMMPVNDTYGPWPSSGEIDIMESRGNNWTYSQGGTRISDVYIDFTLGQGWSVVPRVLHACSPSASGGFAGACMATSPWPVVAIGVTSLNCHRSMMVVLSADRCSIT